MPACMHVYVHVCACMRDMYTHMHTCMHAYMHTYIHTYIYTYISRMYTCIQMYIHACTHTCMGSGVQSLTRSTTHLHANPHVCSRMHVFVYLSQPTSHATGRRKNVGFVEFSNAESATQVPLDILTHIPQHDSPSGGSQIAPEEELSGMSRIEPNCGSPSPLKKETLGAPPYNCWSR